MRHDDGGLLVALVGVFGVVIGMTNAINRYLRPSMSIWLVLSGVVLVVLGAAMLATSWWDNRNTTSHDEAIEHRPHRDDHGHARRHSRVGWLLAAPLAVAVIVNPGALGSYAASRQTTARDLTSINFDLEEYLVTHTFAGQAAELNLAQITVAVSDPFQAPLLAETVVRAEGFVFNDAKRGNRLLIGRIVVGCCAGDGLPVTVELVGYAGPAIEDDQWIQVEGTVDLVATDAARAEGPHGRPVMSIERLELIDAPDEPYLYPY